MNAPVISSRTNARVKQLRAAFAGHARLSGGMVAIEGEHLLEEALRSGMVLKTVFVREGREVPETVPRRVELLRLPEDVFASVVETQSPQGIAALLVPPVRELDDVMHGVPLILIAAGLQDPGNLGTLVRSAEAFGATGVLTTPGTVSAWNQKALRASVGSIFRVPVVAATATEIAGLRAKGMRLLAAVGEGGDVVKDGDFSGSCGLLIGNEGAGLSGRVAGDGRCAGDDSLPRASGEFECRDSGQSCCYMRLRDNELRHLLSEGRDEFV